MSKVCSVPRCPNLQPCTAHPKLAWQRADSPPDRIRGARLQALRDHLFRDEPLCRQCRSEGRITEATIRDHIVPLFEGGTEDASNIQPLCRTCSDAKTARESQRGREKR